MFSNRAAFVASGYGHYLSHQELIEPRRILRGMLKIRKVYKIKVQFVLFRHLGMTFEIYQGDDIHKVPKFPESK
jgi:hypothetical protein